MPDPLERLRPALAGRYRIERELGQGGMAVVFLAQDLKHNRQVALKVLRPELARAIGSERFLREIAIASRLTHPHILPLHDSGEADGLLYYVMPYVEGESLRDRLNQERQLGFDEAVGILRQVGAALSHAHGLGVIHRDIKPENILLGAGQAVVSDFGIARAIDAAGAERLTETGLAIGTPAYMSPEQASGEHASDGRSDVYALGCVAYEMLGGQTPFSGPTAQAVLARHALDPVPRLRTLRPTVPGGVERAIERALAKVPADRFASAALFAEALTFGLTTPPERAGRRLFTRTRLLGVTILVVVALAAAAWWATTSLGTSGARALAILPFENLSGDPEKEYLVAGLHDEMIGGVGQISALHVKSRTSVMRYRGGTSSLQEIARALDVESIVEGSVPRAGDTVRLRLRLIQCCPEERTLWDETYERPARDVPAMYRDAARSIAQALRARLTPEEETRLTGAWPVNPAAYDAYLKGLFFWYRLRPQDLETALRYFEQALGADPQYAPAHAGIAGIWLGRATVGLVPTSEALPIAQASIGRALALDSTNAPAYRVLASIRAYMEWDWAGAREAFQQALRHNPNEAQTRLFYGDVLGVMQQWTEARAQLDRALELDPHNFFFHHFLGRHFLFQRRYDEALASFEETARLEPTFPLVHRNLWFALHQKGRRDEALVAAQRYFTALGHGPVAEALAQGRAEGGYERAFELGAKALADRARQMNVPIEEIAVLYAFAGSKDQALEWLEEAVRQRIPRVSYLGVDPAWDLLRTDPRFRELLRAMRLPASP